MRDSRMKAAATAVALVLLTLSLGLTGASAGGGSLVGEPETLVFEAGQPTTRALDLGKKGPSLGDRLYVRVPLFQEGERAGKVLAVCERAGKWWRLYCTNEMTIDGRGELSAEGFQDLRGSVVVDPVTGGTGDFSGAGGQATVDFSTGSLTIELV